VLAAPASAAPARQRVDLVTLVLDNGSTGVDSIVAELDREGLAYDRVDLADPGRAPITAATLSDTVGGVARAKYQGIIAPNENAVTGAEATVLAAYEKQFGVREIDAYTYAGATVGLTNLWSGTLDGTAMTVTAAGRTSGFGYLNGSLPIDDIDPAVAESYGYLGLPTPPAGATFTPLVEGHSPDGAVTGSLLGVYAHDGREQLVVTLADNRNQSDAQQLGHGLVTWLTKGVHLGQWRNFFTVQVDDFFLPDDRWDAAANCTVGDDCNAGHDPTVQPYNTTIRMTPADVTALVQWQQQHGMKLDVVFNGDGSVEAGAGDPLTASMVAAKAQFRWINHTYSHQYLGCQQNFTVTPWSCVTDGYGTTQWVSQADIVAEITNNVKWAKDKGIAIDPSEVVTGEHSGLKTLPQMAVDNPNLAPALNTAGIKVLASDASRESTPRQVGNAVTVPRHPMNIYYNVATAGEETDEYNWLYTSRADGGSGICEDNPATSTCITPLDPATGFNGYIVPIESRIAYGHVVSGDPAPHYAHQSNLTEDRILYPVLDDVLDRYHATFTAATPIVNLGYSDIATQNARHASWAAGGHAAVEAYTLDGKVTVINHGAARDVPVTVPAGTKSVTVSLLGLEMTGSSFGDAYGGEQSTWKNVARGGQLTLRLPS
jgi:hypothetical protein